MADTRLGREQGEGMEEAESLRVSSLMTAMIPNMVKA